MLGAAKASFKSAFTRKSDSYYLLCNGQWTFSHEVADFARYKGSLCSGMFILTEKKEKQTI